MKQRLGIAQAMINNPEILILDEPTVGLDPKERVKFRKLISSFASEKIVLLSTHIVSDIEYIADEIIILKKGRIENTGTIRYLLKDINKCVWECLVPEKEVNRIEQVYTVSNRKYGEDGVVLRLISREKPFANAKQVDPVLEDLYLFYFREGNESMTSLIKFELGKILRNRTVFGGIVVGCLVLLGIFLLGITIHSYQ